MNPKHKILITGGAGFIGCHVVKQFVYLRLKEYNKEVKNIDFR